MKRRQELGGAIWLATGGLWAWLVVFWVMSVIVVVLAGAILAPLLLVLGAVAMIARPRAH